MKCQDESGNGQVSIRTIQRGDVNPIAVLHHDFESYLRSLDPKRPKDSSPQFRARLLRDGFGPHAAFNGFVAVQEEAILGYVLYHAGYDPDEMRGRVYYVIDLYVTERSRRCGIGRKLMKKVVDASRKRGAIDVYFAVWTKNPSAEAFYHKIGASHNPELRFYHLNKLVLLGAKEAGSVHRRPATGHKKAGYQ